MREEGNRREIGQGDRREGRKNRERREEGGGEIEKKKKKNECNK